MTTRNSSIKIGSLVVELDRALENWRRTEESAELVAILNRIGDQFGILGGAFGVLNRASNIFELHRLYPVTDQDARGPAIFPYSGAKVSRDLAIPAVTEEVFSERMHALFKFQRDEQRLEPTVAPQESEPSTIPKVPEFFRHLINIKHDQGSRPYIFAESKHIYESLSKWLSIWRFAACSDHGLTTTIDLAREYHQKEISSNNFLEVIQKGMKNSLISASWIRDRLPNFPEYAFFREEPAKAHIQFGRDLAKSVSVDDIKKRFDTYLFKDEPNDRTLFTLLSRLYLQSFFPIVPYWFLSIVYNFPISHYVLPLFHSTAFPTKVSIPQSEAEDKSEQKDVIYSLVFLATLDIKKEDEHTDDEWASLKLLLGHAAEPILDRVFYGNIQRRYIEQETYGGFFRAITHELDKLRKRLAGQWLRPITECFDLSTAAPCATRAPFGSLSISPEAQEIASKFLVVTTPTFYTAAAEYLGLWTSRDWLETVKISEPMSFREAIDRLMRSSAQSHWIRERFTNFRKMSFLTPKGILELETRFNDESLQLANRLIDGLEKTTATLSLQWFPWDSENQESMGLPIEEEAQLFCRLLVAIFTNSLQHAGQNEISTEIKFNRHSHMVTVTQTNPCTSEPRDPKPNGTLSVLNFLVSELNKSSQKPKQEVIFKKQGATWVTRCTVGARFCRILPSAVVEQE